MLEVKNIDISIGTRYLVQNLSFVVNKYDKLAIIGEEGNGKSTLLKALCGECDYAVRNGEVLAKGSIGYLEQSLSSTYLNWTVKNYLFFDDNDYYDKLNVLYKYLDLLGIEDTLFDQVMDTLSGGEKIKIGILKLLLHSYDILFLDEPTNDLDIETLEWLETFIKSCDKPIVFVSHDETLLSRTATMILHIEQVKHKTECRYTLMKCGYEEFLETRTRRILHQTQISKAETKELKKKEEKLRQLEQIVAHQQRTISRSDPHGAKVLKKKMHSLKSQEKRLNNMEITELPEFEEEIHFFFDSVSLPKKKVILNFSLPELQIGERILVKNISLSVSGGEHLAIVGKNGVGKSTLLKLIYEELYIRKDIRLGYMPQNYEDILESFATPLDFLKSGATLESEARAYLGNMHFTRDEMTGSMKSLSNGSKAKLFFAKFVLEHSDVLLLDEPTRNVSPLSGPVIRSVLKEFGGTIISVSHDRKYLEEVAAIVYELNEKGLEKL